MSVNQRTRVAGTLAEMRAMRSTPVNQICFLLGKDAKFDEALKTYHWDPSLTDEDNYPDVVRPDDYNEKKIGGWRLVL